MEDDTTGAYQKRRLVDLGHLKRVALPIIDALDILPREANWREWLGSIRADQIDQVPAIDVLNRNIDRERIAGKKVIVDPKQLRIEYHPASDGTGAKTPDDIVTVDLATRKFVPSSAT